MTGRTNLGQSESRTETSHTSTIPAFFSRQSLAAYLQISTRTLDRLVAGHRLPPSVQIGSAKRWARTAILEWVAQGCPDMGEVKPARRDRR
jgi:predicted DNA-binding transcriptional regulator AlpA